MLSTDSVASNEKVKVYKLNVLITGGAGFIGSNLAKKLVEIGHEVTIVDNFKFGTRDNLNELPMEQIVLLEMDLRDIDLPEFLVDFDCVFHLAGISSLPECEADPVEAFDVNTTITAKLLHAARYSNLKRFVFASTSAVYENNSKVPFSEEDFVDPDLIYSQTKIASERIVKSFSSNYGMDTVICRFFNVYGPNQDFQRRFPPFTSYLARELAAGRIPVIYNNEPVERDYVFVDDLLDMLVLIMSSAETFRGEIFNLTSNFSYTPLDILNALAKELGNEPAFIQGNPLNFWNSEERLTGSNFPLDQDRIKKEVLKKSTGSPMKFFENFGYLAATEMQEGMRQIIKYQTNFKS
jgi:UDP-glucose 4-epimerase